MHNGEDAPYIVREGKKSPHRAILIHIDNITIPLNATLQTRMNVFLDTLSEAMNRFKFTFFSIIIDRVP